jgi:5'-3' exonuclease
MKKSKQELVESYLNERMESEKFNIDDLFKLTVDELAEIPELEGIGKITISTVLADFKGKYEDNFFSEIDEGMVSEAGKPILELKQEEIQVIRKIIQERAEKQNAELIELKLALKNAGIDYMMILKDYRTQKELELKEWEESADY